MTKLITALIVLLLLNFSAAIKAGAAESDATRPVIGFNIDVEGKDSGMLVIPKNYADAIVRAGGVPILIPPIPAEDVPSVISKIDGIVFIGGPDYDPVLYHEKAGCTVNLMDPARAKNDLALVSAVLKQKDVPCLGICAGSQLINIAFGGTLFQDIPTSFPDSRIKHRRSASDPVDQITHAVKLAPGSKLQKIYGKTELTVVSNHHQCVDKIGAGLVATAWAPDGVTEAIETQDNRFLIGVQYHPERDFNANELLFKALVERAREHQKARVASLGETVSH